MNLKEALAYEWDGVDACHTSEALGVVKKALYTLSEENLKLHRQLAHEKLRADTGWQRYESANKAHMAALNVIADNRATMQLVQERLGKMETTLKGT
jgi:hypothetical protein